jgi:hypothetical protein
MKLRAAQTSVAFRNVIPQINLLKFKLRTRSSASKIAVEKQRRSDDDAVVADTSSALSTRKIRDQGIAGTDILSNAIEKNKFQP